MKILTYSPTARQSSSVRSAKSGHPLQTVNITREQVVESTTHLWAVLHAPPMVPLHIISDSLYAIEGLTIFLEMWDAIGWIGVANKEFFRPTAAHMQDHNNEVGKRA